MMSGMIREFVIDQRDSTFSFPPWAFRLDFEVSVVSSEDRERERERRKTVYNNIQAYIRVRFQK